MKQVSSIILLIGVIVTPIIMKTYCEKTNLKRQAISIEETLENLSIDTFGMKEAILDFRCLGELMLDRWKGYTKDSTLTISAGFIPDRKNPNDPKGFVMASVPRIIATAFISQNGCIMQIDSTRQMDLFNTFDGVQANRFDYWANFVEIIKDSTTASQYGHGWIWSLEGQNLVRLVTEKYTKPILLEYEQEIARLQVEEERRAMREVVLKAVSKMTHSAGKSNVATEIPCDPVTFPLCDVHFVSTATENYVKAYWETAVEEMHTYGIPASITIAQGILESTSGRSKLATRSNNHFGMKWYNKYSSDLKWDYYHDDCCIDAGGKCGGLGEKFVHYQSAWWSFRDHSKLLLRPHYKPCHQYGKKDYHNWAYALKECGYATNKKYPELLLGIIKKYKLYRLDNQPEPKPRV